MGDGLHHGDLTDKDIYKEWLQWEAMTAIISICSDGSNYSNHIDGSNDNIHSNQSIHTNDRVHSLFVLNSLLTIYISTFFLKSNQNNKCLSIFWKPD